MFNATRHRYKLLHYFVAIFFVALLSSAAPTQTFAADKDWTYDDYKQSLSHIERSPALVRAIENAIDTLPVGTTTKTEIDLRLWQLDILVKLNQPQAATTTASEIYTTYDLSLIHI